MTGMALATSITGQSAFTIAEFCKRNSISRGMFYKLLAAGQGPRLMQVGTHKRISAEAEADWKRAVRDRRRREGRMNARLKRYGPRSAR